MSLEEERRNPKLRSLDTQIAEAEARGAEKPQEQLDYWDKLLELTSTRLEFLRVYSRKGIPKGVTATYRDFEGGIRLAVQAILVPMIAFLFQAPFFVI